MTVYQYIDFYFKELLTVLLTYNLCSDDMNLVIFNQSIIIFSFIFYKNGIFDKVAVHGSLLFMFS